jgi:SlyX protein
MSESRFEDIEIKLTRQEDLLETLNMQVYQQQKKIDRLELLCASLAQRLKDLAVNPSQTGLPHEKPPHY